MKSIPAIDEWTERIVRDPAARGRALRWAQVTETVCSLAGTLAMFGAVWGFTQPAAEVGHADPRAVGGMALLVFCGCMIGAASGGIRRRLITLVAALEARPR